MGWKKLVREGPTWSMGRTGREINMAAPVGTYTQGDAKRLHYIGKRWPHALLPT